MKKVYFRIDNGDTPVICELSGVITLLEAEAQDVKNSDDMEDYEWTITPVLLTEEQYDNLPEAY